MRQLRLAVPSDEIDAFGNGAHQLALFAALGALGAIAQLVQYFLVLARLLFERLVAHAITLLAQRRQVGQAQGFDRPDELALRRSEEHTSGLQSPMRNSYSAFRL